MAWEPLPLPVDQDQIITTILTGIATAIPGWVPIEGAPEVALAEEIGVQLAAVNAAAVAAANYAAAGVAAAFGFEPIEGTKAVLQDVTLTAQLPPSAGTAAFSRAVTVPAGFTITIGGQPFIVPKQVTRVAAFTQVTAGDFTGYWRGIITADFAAYEAGDEWNIGAAGDVASIQTVSPVIIAATLTAPASGGEGAETLTAFLSRFTAWLATLKPGGVRAADLAAFAATVPGVRRALALDRYDPENPGTPADRTVTIIPIDAAGGDLASFEVDRLRTEIESIREVGFIVHIIDPVRTPVTVDVTVTVAVGGDVTAVQSAVATAVEAALSPAAWGSGGDPAAWAETTTLRTLDVALVVANVPDVAAIGAITLNGDTADVTLTGPGALIDATVEVTAS
ncbi:baseplate J/gp47 family protein [Microbacterium betulae]|uniref:Baseplate J/gp47 family protein n=1 Tax=Microbacterium betulae TaxID=2981139 RepID=A0AA97FJ10_9MICO|nr:baseplate J/gp47 family protein [Microbacterium sp. AB]WOF23848.1 baseplate J/gp47 family protein [Microbacterium sp. AB]